MFNAVLNYLFPDDTIDLDKIDKEMHTIYTEAKTRFEHLQNLIKEINKPVDIFIKTPVEDKIYSQDEKSILLSMFEIVCELETLPLKYICKVTDYSTQIKSPISLSKRYEYLALMRQYAQEEAIKIETRIKEEDKKFKSLLENANRTKNWLKSNTET